MTPAPKQLRFLNTAALIRGEESVVGRSDYSTIPIPHPSVSRIHASITQREGAIFIKDLGSRNGTFVNEERVLDHPIPLKVGDCVRIGHVDCFVESTADNSRVTTDDPFEHADGDEPTLRPYDEPDDD